jgi:16S rRNA (cytosine1402-N4)-methyltransferase
MMTARPLTHKAPLTEGHVHEPVLVRECVELLRARPGSRIVDATLGTGGHAEALLERVAPSGRVIGIDRDPRAIEIACSRLARFGPAFRALHGNHDELPQLLDSVGVGPVDGILIDLGVSSLQLDDPSRGFSFRHDGLLDMRMDPTRGPTAADLLAHAPAEELGRILSEYGEEHAARAIARAIVRRRERAPLERTAELRTLVEETLGPRARRYRIHPATRTFQALRIAVNGEIVALRRTVARAAERIAPGGRLVVLSYHSLEDRAVKEELRALAGSCTCPPRLPICACGAQGILRILPPSPIRPGDAEIERNPRSRSARLRAAERR